jgi:hypothetical protein
MRMKDRFRCEVLPLMRKPLPYQCVLYLRIQPSLLEQYRLYLSRL